MTEETIYDQLVAILGEPPTIETEILYSIIGIMMLILTMLLVWKFINSMFNK